MARFPLRALGALSLVVTLYVGGSAGAWSAGGGNEPDFYADVSRGFMWAGPDWDPNPGVQKVYFNAVLAPVSGHANPNAAPVASKIGLPVPQRAFAYLGVWKDCNGDGYIGMAETAAEVYASTLLVGPYNTFTCPPGTTHNNAGWVYEFRWIGPADVGPLTSDLTHADATLGTIADTEAEAWNDCYEDGTIDALTSLPVVGPYTWGACGVSANDDARHVHEALGGALREGVTPRDPAAHTIPRMINDTGARVWGDLGRYDQGRDGAAGPKRSSDLTFRFRTNTLDDNARRGCAATGVPTLPRCTSGQDAILSPETPNAFGANRALLAPGSGPGWWSEETIMLPAGDATYVTYYARVSVQALVYGLRLPGGIDTYGGYACGSNSSHVLNGWDCDPTHWWDPAWGAPAMPTQAGRPIGQTVGWSIYNLRDVDCYDGSALEGLVPTFTVNTCPS